MTQEKRKVLEQAGSTVAQQIEVLWLSLMLISVTHLVE